MAKISNFGFGAMTKSSLGNPKELQKRSSTQSQIILRVIDIILDENHLSWDPKKGINQLGTIFGNQSFPDGTVSSIIIKAKPAFSGVTKIPLVNEYVKAFPSVVPNLSTESFVYSDIVPIWGMISPNANPYPSNLTNLNPPSQNLSYDQINAGAFNVVNNKPLEISLNSPNNISQNITDITNLTNTKQDLIDVNNNIINTCLMQPDNCRKKMKKSKDYSCMKFL